MKVVLHNNGGKFVDGSYLDYYNESSIFTNEPEFGLQNYNYYACEYKGKTRCWLQTMTLLLIIL